VCHIPRAKICLLCTRSHVTIIVYHVSWGRIGALNDRFDWVANALEITFVDPNTWIEDGDFARDGLHLNGRGKRRLGQLYARVSGLDDGALTGCKL
jgi:hypothetical protein